MFHWLLGVLGMAKTLSIPADDLEIGSWYKIIYRDRAGDLVYQYGRFQGIVIRHKVLWLRFECTFMSHMQDFTYKDTEFSKAV